MEHKVSENAVSNYGHGKIERGYTTKTIYVQDIPNWDRAKDHAEKIGLSMSELIARAIKSYVDGSSCPVCDRMREVMMVGSQPMPEVSPKVEPKAEPKPKRRK